MIKLPSQSELPTYIRVKYNFDGRKEVKYKSEEAHCYYLKPVLGYRGGNIAPLD